MLVNRNHKRTRGPEYDAEIETGRRGVGRFNGKRNKGSGGSWRDRVRFRNKNPEYKDQQKGKEKKGNDGKDKRQLTDEELYKQIGSSDAFNDTSSEASYDWDTKISPFVLSSEDEIKKLTPLKTLCAMKIAENQDLLTLQLLEVGNWSTWKEVWEFMANWRRDSFLMFQLFAGAFSIEPSFKAHPFIQNYPESKKKVLMTNTFPNSSNHRIERLFSNVKLPQFTNSLNYCQFDNLVILELSKPLFYEDYLNLTNLARLTSLKISRLNNNITDSIIHSWCSALKAKKWNCLQLLSIPGISQDSFIKLQKTASHCRLLYLEIQTKSLFNMTKEWTNLDYVNWEILNDKSINNLSWGMKTLTILRKFAIENHSITPRKSTMCLDFNIMNHTYNERFKYKQGEYDHIWNMGELQTYYQGILLKKKPQLSSNEVTGNSAILKPNLKKKTIKTKVKANNLNSFFDL